MTNKKNLLFLIVLFNTLQLFSQVPNGGNLKAVCDWTNGCDNPSICCRIKKGGESCDNFVIYDSDGNPKVKCNANANPPVTNNCYECFDLKIANNAPILTEYEMGIHTYDGIQYRIVANSNDGNGKIRIYNSVTNYLNVFDFSDYTISDSGLTVWHTAINNIVNIIYAEGSLYEAGTYRASTLDTISFDLDTLFGSSLPSQEQLNLLYQNWLNTQLNIIVSPNPNNGNFKIELKSTHPAVIHTNMLQLELYTIDGKLLHQQAVSANTSYPIKLSNTLKGEMLLYVVKWDLSSIKGNISVVK
jgi:hypothetical protein